MPSRPPIQLDDVVETWYRPADDTVHMLRRERRRSDEAYYETLLHELVHATGHKSLLDRFRVAELPATISAPGQYAQEELVAEMGAGFLCAECGIFRATEDNTTA